VQPHGAFVAALADGLRVSHASANLAAMLGTPAALALGRPLEQVFGAAACRSLLDGGPAGGIAKAQVHLMDAPHGGTLYLHAHRSGRHVCVDIEPMHFEPPQRLPIIMAQSVLRTFEQAGSARHLCELAVQGLKAITGYDRVMAYRFGEDGHGEVIAESLEARLEPFLGLRYPASDIPAQARRLFLRQRVGMIGDAGATPVPLLADPALDDGTPLDLTHSALRSASPIHREYMRNMHTAASLTVALVHRGELWGMLVCHHSTARVAGPELRAAADTIGQVVSLLLESLGESEVLAQRLVRNTTLRALADAMAGAASLSDALVQGQADLLRLVDATGALVRLGGPPVLLGSTPDPGLAERALKTLLEAAQGELLAIDDLGRRFPALAQATRQGSGALLLPLTPDGGDAVLWFRPELARTVTWAGNPAVHGSFDPLSARISPRASFAAWQETVKGISAPWTDVDLAVARDLRTAIQAEQVQRTKAALLESEARLGLLAEHSGVVVALSSLDGVRSFVSPAAERVLGWRPQDMVGHAAREFVHPDDWPALADATRTLLGPAGQSSATYRFRRPDGSWLWVDGHSRLRPAAEGEPATDYVVVLRDATERKAAEIKLLDALQQMERMAATDGLTGLANRRHLDVVADREWRRCVRARLPMSVLMVDADRFKRFNDRYGHLAGDDCLRAIATQLAAVAQRPGDLAARYGGEEFVLLLPQTGRAGALTLAERVCGLVRSLAVAHEGNGSLGIVTVSIGAATAVPGDPAGASHSMAALLAAADAALYEAKSGGRNRVAQAAAPPAIGE
jgi:diguanylate cyclase (GGDEF)-like protein/PAS domain S-box-containing protein